MYIWRKRATREWLRERDEDLERRCGGTLAIVERPGKRTVLEVVSNTRREAAQLQDEFGGIIERLASDWLQQATKRMRTKPLRIGSRLRIDRTPGPNTIVIPAEAAFGTGEHATTAMCLRMLERVTRKFPHGWSMLDAGTGSGILAIAGCRFGATRIVAIDNDPLACATARRNARRNRVRNIEFRIGDVKQKLRAKFDIITANLFSELLIAALPTWLPTLAEEGRLIFSGVLRSQESALMTALRRHGCRIAEIKRRGKWIAVLATRARKRS
jgi:ribosomal protein L11 methyltransferase